MGHFGKQDPGLDGPEPVELSHVLMICQIKLGNIP